MVFPLFVPYLLPLAVFPSWIFGWIPLVVFDVPLASLLPPPIVRNIPHPLPHPPAPGQYSPQFVEHRCCFLEYFASGKLCWIIYLIFGRKRQYSKMKSTEQEGQEPVEQSKSMLAAAQFLMIAELVMAPNLRDSHSFRLFPFFSLFQPFLGFLRFPPSSQSVASIFGQKRKTGWLTLRENGPRLGQMKPTYGRRERGGGRRTG